MSQEVYKYIETALEKKETLFQAEVINLNQIKKKQLKIKLAI